MRDLRARSVLLAVLTMMAVGGCGGGRSDEPVAVPFTKVELPAGSAPVALSTSGDALLIGVRRAGQPLVPGLLRRVPDGTMIEVAVHEATPYGGLARWYSIASDGDRVLAIGGERGGAHGNVRWSVWTGSAEGITEKQQSFYTFGGPGASDLVDAVLTPVGPAVVGMWSSDQAGVDVTVWTPDGDLWTRRPSAGTVLESTRAVLTLPTAATTLQQGILVVGSQLETGPGRQTPVVWRSSSGNTGWTGSPLPDAGQIGAAVAVRCWGAGCGVAGRVDGRLALWRLVDGAWLRVAGTPPIAVGEKDRMAAPVEVDGRLTQVVSDGGQVKIARIDGDRWTVRGVAGPGGRVTAVTVVGRTIYLLAGPDEDTQTLWRADADSLR